jgi:hypothetical protein
LGLIFSLSNRVVEDHFGDTNEMVEIGTDSRISGFVSRATKFFAGTARSYKK